MKSKHSFILAERPPLVLSLALAGAMVAAMAYLRLVVAPAKVLPIAYGVPLVICIWFRNRAILWSMAASFTFITFVKYAFFWTDDPNFAGDTRWAAWGMIQADLLVIAVVVHYVIGAREAVETHARELETGNVELSAREQQIIRQNGELQAQAEEMQSQTEELERQSEELRVANDELEAREHMLEHLLELSQSLTADLTREQVMCRVCEAVEGLLGISGGTAAAVTEKVDGRLRIAASCGLGPNGSEEELPWDRSFTALVLEQGQTGYVQDCALRPDLRIPQAGSGEPLRSILATPLKMRGGALATVEIYSHRPREWTRQEIVMIEALASQATRSLENVRLVQEIEAERRRLATIFRTLPVGVVIADADGSDIRMNAAAAQMFELTPEINVARDPLPFQFERNGRPVDLSEVGLLRALRRGEEIRGEERDLVFPDGRRITQLASASPILDGEGRIVGAVSTLVDITTLKGLQRELEQRRRDAEEAAVRKTRFLAAVSHDIRTPANAINLLAELLRRTAEDPRPGMDVDIPELAKELQASALSLVHLVSDVLDVTRYDYGKTELNLSEFPLRQLLEEQARQHRPLADSKGLSLLVEPPVDITLKTDAIKLGRVLSNLLGNAVKFTESGSVTITAAKLDDGRVRLSVSDTGPGIDAEHQARIFDEFFQIKNPARDRTKGTGLGLAICKRLVEAMGGQLEVQSEEGRGSTFIVTLPPWVAARASIAASDASDTPHESPAAEGRTAASPPDAGASLADLRVLLVEDHEATRRATARILTAEGALVTEAADGRTAMEQLDIDGHDALLLDMMLPDLDGREVLKRLKTQRSHELRTVLVMTGDVTAERAKEVLELGADALMHKPINAREVVLLLGGRRNGKMR